MNQMKLIKPNEGKEPNSSFWGQFENDEDNKANRSSKDHTKLGPYADHRELIADIRKVRRQMKDKTIATAKGKKKIRDLREDFRTEQRDAFAFMAGGMTELVIQKVGNEYRVTIARPEGRASHAFESDPNKVDETINSYRVIADCDLIKFAYSKNEEKLNGIYIGTIS